MKNMSLYYKAFKELKKVTETHNDAKRARKKLVETHNELDSLIVLKYDCMIDSDWITEIENTLEFIEKAIREDRQFITSEGNVLPIEKVKKTSKETIKHLSQHSDLITHVPEKESDPLIPDKLYVVEKLSDYLVYENRFIFMLLSYLRDFIELRITKVKEKVTTYHMEVKMNKQINDNYRKMIYKLDYEDTFKNDPYLTDNYYKIPNVKRMENAYAQVISMLSTELMKQVAKAPIIKPPVVKTNVLRMNQNFKKSLALYDYITSYTKDGYTLTEHKNEFNPFDLKMADNIVETIELSTLISYSFGQNLLEQLEQEYQIELEKLQQEEIKKFTLEVSKLKNKVENGKLDPLEYIVKLEKLVELKDKQIETLSAEIKDSLKHLDTIEQLNDKVEINEKQIAALEKVIEEKTDQLVLNSLEHETTIKNLKEEHLNNLNTLKNDYLEELEKTKIEQDETIKQIKEEFTEKENHYEEKVKTLNETNEQKNQEISKYKDDLETIIHEKRELNARYYGLREKNGLNINEDFTSKKDFKELELEMDAYKKFFKEQWKKTKIRIKKEVKEELNTKGQKRKNTKENEKEENINFDE
ncbi:conserved hypothetical protein [Alteracholeplasma palmae J233]|uniref:DUF2357 domain-containing protein n=1 Tax=Alteracholeplasma palmae (strain ATCC 49389 / J233) TaxID=1318466 RepID=U4KL10_ALTPJ|nr:hypothetical protein [Alteracholeplasma palmae]CCV64407.1 conserved hypothetical protein [Alteracholeplasma palmae J233]